MTTIKKILAGGLLVALLGVAAALPARAQFFGSGLGGISPLGQLITLNGLFGGAGYGGGLYGGGFGGYYPGGFYGGYGVSPLGQLLVLNGLFGGAY